MYDKLSRRWEHALIGLTAREPYWLEGSGGH